MIRTIWVSLYQGSIINPTGEFLGFQNYLQLLTSDPFFLRLDLPPWSAVFNSGLWVVLFTSGVVVMGLAVAVLSDGVRYEKIVKAIVFLPLVVSFTAASVVFTFVYAPDPNIGVLNAILVALGFEPIAFLGRTEFVNFAIIVAAIWVWTSLAMTILAAAYRSLPGDVIEASAVDGASAWQTFWRVSLPMMKGPVIVVAVIMIVNALKAIDLVLVMTEGGPRNASRIVGFTVYWEIFNNNKAGYGSAAAVVLLVLMAPLMWYQMRQIRQGVNR
ncbi:MAG: sugar ABC transporter permease [Actinomycetota bacterium]|nr:sugar ABC transporter permease [Actinomycetota bacterium]